MLAIERASKANEICNNLRSALDAKKQSSTALREHVSLLNTRMEALEGIALVTAETYKAAVDKFGRNTSALLEETSAYNLLSWLKSHVEKVPFVMGGTVDFAALASTTLFAKVLARASCVHTTKVQNEALADVASLGETSGTLRKSLRAFTGSFWPLWSSNSQTIGRGSPRGGLSPCSKFLSFVVFLLFLVFLLYF
jgi:hypothetical protein